MGEQAVSAVGQGGGVQNERLGALLVFGSAFFWSFGGTIARFLSVQDSWTVVFWRCLFGGLFLLAFMLVRDGPRGTVRRPGSSCT